MVINLILDLKTKKKFLPSFSSQILDANTKTTAKIPISISSPVHVIPPGSAMILPPISQRKPSRTSSLYCYRATNFCASVHPSSWHQACPSPPRRIPRPVLGVCPHTSTFLGTWTTEYFPSVSSVSCFLLFPFPVQTK